MVIGVVAALVGFKGVGFLASSASRDRAQHINHDAGLIFAGIERSLRGVESELLAFKGLFAATEETAELISGYRVFASIDGAHSDPSLRSVCTGS